MNVEYLNNLFDVEFSQVYDAQCDVCEKRFNFDDYGAICDELHTCCSPICRHALGYAISLNLELAQDTMMLYRNDQKTFEWHKEVYTRALHCLIRKNKIMLAE